jgi:hypothetical protein
MVESDFQKIKKAIMQGRIAYGFTEDDFQKTMTVVYWTKDNDPQYP